MHSNDEVQTTELNTQMRDLVAAQRAYHKSGATLPLQFRLEALHTLKALIEDNEEELHAAIYEDFGKSKYENQLTEIYPLIDEIEVAIKNLKGWMKPQKVKTNLVNFPAKSYLVPEPLGVSLIIGAWNFPYNLTLTPLVGAIAGGNTAIVKPSEMPAATSRIMARLLHEAFDPRFIKVVEGAIPETTALLNQRFDKIFFTGSPQVGKIVNKAAAEHLTNVTLELGGKNPALFTKDATLDVGVKRLIWAKFVNSGQFCITADYVLVHKDRKDEFMELAVAEIEKSNFSLENNNYVQIINDRNFERVVGLIDQSKVYYGGGSDAATRLIEPTLMHNVTLDDAVMQEEIFGPVLPVITYETLDEAFEIIKSIEKPLAAYIYTNDAKAKERFLTEIPFGSGAVNDTVMQISNPNLPFGGVGNSGMGRYHGKYSFECFSHYKAVLDKPAKLETNLKYYGYDEKKMNLMRKLF